MASFSSVVAKHGLHLTLALLAAAPWPACAVGFVKQVKWETAQVDFGGPPLTGITLRFLPPSKLAASAGAEGFPGLGTEQLANSLPRKDWELYERLRSAVMESNLLFGDMVERDSHTSQAAIDHQGFVLLRQAPALDWVIMFGAVVLFVALDYFVLQRGAFLVAASLRGGHGLDQPVEERLREAFERCDTDGKGRVSLADLMDYFDKRPDSSNIVDVSKGQDTARFKACLEHLVCDNGAMLSWEEVRRCHVLPGGSGCIATPMQRTPRGAVVEEKDTDAWRGGARSHIAVLILWIFLGFCFNLIIWYRRGVEAGLQWFSGYILEWLLSMDNLFVFHLIFQTYATPRSLLHKALFLGIFGAVIFRMLFFMALSSLLHMVHWVRFFFGVLLIYSGIQAARGEDDEPDVTNTMAVQMLKACLGSRLSDTYDVEGRCLLVRNAAGRLQATLLVPVCVCLEVTDIFFAIDSVSAKVAQIPDYYICLSSSVIALFGLRAMFFIIQDIVDCFELMKYGLSFILVFIGIELMFSDYLQLSAQVVCVIILSVFLGCAVGSTAQRLMRTSKELAAEAATEEETKAPEAQRMLAER